MPLVDLPPYEPWMQRGAVVDGSFRWRLGTHPLDLCDWIEFGPDVDGPDGWLAQKPRLNERHRDQVFVALDDVAAESTEVADAVVAHLAEHHPERHRVLDPDLHPFDAAARLIPEDLTMLVERDGELVFGAGSVCFPNRWDLPSKLGASMRDVHRPVAELNDQLGVAIDRFFVRLTPHRSFSRLGWGVIDTPEGFAPPGSPGRADSGGLVLDDLFVRVERETLRRFPATNCVLFTIRTYVSPLAAQQPGSASARAMAAAIRSMSADVAGYKNLDSSAPFVAELLES